MNIIQSIVLGAIQGLTEFLPVSSSGHLHLFQDFMNTDVPRLFDIILHVGTLVAVIFYYRKRVLELIMSLGALGRLKNGTASVEEQNNLKFILHIIIATLCLGFAYFIKDIEFTTKFVSGFFIFTGIVLLITKFIPVQDKPLTAVRSVIIGLSQAIGVLPGISRSGMTISASLATGVKREKAAEFSFILSIPAILMALVLDVKDGGELLAQMDVVTLVTGFFTAMLVGLGALVFLVKLVKGGKFFLFSIYLIPLGIYGLFFL